MNEKIIVEKRDFIKDNQTSSLIKLIINKINKFFYQ